MTRDMTSGSPIRRILLFCIPLLIGNLFQQFYNLADSIIVGKFLGVNAFAAVGSTSSLNFLVLGFALGICSGFSIPIAQSFGAHDEKMLRRRVAQAIYLGIAFSLLITLLTYFLTEPVLRLINTPPEIFEDAFRYIFIIFMGAGTSILYNLVSGILRALGDSRTPLFFLIIACIINIALDLLFIGVFGMGVEGAAYATVIAQGLSGLLCIFYIKSHVPVLALSTEDMHPDFRQLGILISAGVPMGLQFSITAIGSITLQGAVNGLGADAVASVSAAQKIQLIVTAPLETLGIAMATFCGQNLGARKPERIRKGVGAITKVSMLYCVLAFLLNYFGSTVLAQLFLSGASQKIYDGIHLFLVINSAAYPMLAIIYIYRNSLQGLGFSSSAMLAGVTELAARLIAAFIFAVNFEFLGVCFANPLAWLFADIFLLTLYAFKIRKLHARLSAESESEQIAEDKSAQPA